MKDKTFIKEFIKNMRQNDLKSAKDNVKNVLMEKYSDKKEQIKTEKNI